MLPRKYLNYHAITMPPSLSPIELDSSTSAATTNEALANLEAQSIPDTDVGDAQSIPDTDVGDAQSLPDTDVGDAQSLPDTDAGSLKSEPPRKRAKTKKAKKAASHKSASTELEVQSLPDTDAGSPKRKTPRKRVKYSRSKTLKQLSSSAQKRKREKNRLSQAAVRAREAKWYVSHRIKQSFLTI